MEKPKLQDISTISNCKSIEKAHKLQFVKELVYFPCFFADTKNKIESVLKMKLN